MLGEAAKLIREVKLLGTEVGGENTIVILALLIISLCVIIIVRQGSKHFKQMKEDTLRNNMQIQEELEIVKKERAICLGDKVKLTKELSDSHKMIVELKEVNKEQRKEIADAKAAHLQMTEMFSQTMDYLINSKQD